MNTIVLLAIMPASPSLDYDACVAQAERERRPLVVFMGTPAEKLEGDLWIATCKPDTMPLPSVLVYMPHPSKSCLEYAGWTVNADDARRIVREEMDLRGFHTRQEPSLFDWIPRMKRMPRQ